MGWEIVLLLLFVVSIALAAVVFSDRKLRQNGRAVMGTLLALAIGCAGGAIYFIAWSLTRL